MGLFTPDLYRSFAIGFALGAVALMVTIGGDARAQLVDAVLPTAHAAAVN